MIHTASIPSARIAELAQCEQPHLRPIYDAVAAAGVGLFLVRQRAAAPEAPFLLCTPIEGTA